MHYFSLKSVTPRSSHRTLGSGRRKAYTRRCVHGICCPNYCRPLLCNREYPPKAPCINWVPLCKLRLSNKRNFYTA